MVTLTSRYDGQVPPELKVSLENLFVIHSYMQWGHKWSQQLINFHRHTDTDPFFLTLKTVLRF